MFVDKITLKNFKSFKTASVKLTPGISCVIGPNGSGKCLRGDMRVFLADGSVKRIRDIVETTLAGGERVELDDGICCLGGNITVHSLNFETLELEKKKVTAVVKRSAPDSLYELKTTSGKRIVATGYHPVISIVDGEVKCVDADKLKPGCFVGTPRKLEVKGKAFNPLTAFFDVNVDAYIKDEGTLTRRLKEKKIETKITWRRMAESARVPLNAIKGLLDGQAIKLFHAVSLARYAGFTQDEMTLMFRRVKSKSGNKFVRVPVELDCYLARWLGLLISEGRIAKNEVFFYNDDETLRRDFSSLTKRVFGVNAIECSYKEKKFMIFPSKVVACLLSEVFGLKINGHSSTKNTPSQLFKARDEVIAAFVSGLFDGDGTVSKGRKICLEYTSASEELVDGLNYLFLRLGLHSRKRVRTIKGKQYYRLFIYGRGNAARFHSCVPLLSSKKINRLQRIVSSGKEDTNVDVVPGVNQLVKNALRENGYTGRKLKKVKPSKIRAYYENRCLPTRNGLKQVAALLNGGSVSMTLERLAESSVFWDKLAEVKKVDSGEWVYDLCVEGNHNFVAEGIIVHNSNLADALSFAFGESHLKQMRVKKTGDLVFQGAEVAEATVEFDEKGKARSITRKIKQDGKTKYLLDGKRVNKYVIEEFLADRRISLNNFIKQGEVQRIVEMNPKDRRGLIDSTANISEYEEKKKDAFGELGKVEEKLGEARISIHEKEGYLQELKADKENAVAWRDTDTQLRRVKCTLASIQKDAMESEFDGVSKKLIQAEAEEEGVQARIGGIAAKIDKENAAKEEINKQINARAIGQEGELQREISTLENAVENNKQAIDEKKQAIERLDNKRKEAQLALQRVDGEVKATDRNARELREEVDSLAKSRARADEELKRLLDEEKNFSQGFHEARKKIQLLTEETHATKDSLNALQSEVAALQDRKGLREQELERLGKGSPAEDYSAKTRELEIEKKNLERELLGKENEHKKSFDREKKLNEHLTKVEEALLEAREKHSEHSSRLRMAGENSGTDLLAAKRLKESLKGVHGQLQELVSFKEEYALPASVALGPRLNFLVVDSVKTAGQAVDYLKKNKLDRLSFIPLDKIQSRKPSSENRTLAKSEGAASFLLDAMEYDASIAKAVEYACGNTLITKDYASAEPLVRKLRLVTMQGELIEASGLVTGGQTKRKINVYSEQAAVAKWSGALESAKEEKSAIHSELEALRDSLAEARRDKARVELQLRTTELELEHLAKTESEWLARNADAKNAASALKKEIRECEEQAETKEKEKRALIKKLSELNVNLLSTKQKVDVETEARLGNLVREKEHKATELATELNKYKALFEGAENKKGYAEREANAARKRFDEVDAEIKSCRNAINEADDEIRAARERLKEKKAKQKEFSKEFKELLDEREALEKEMGKLGNEKGKLEFELDKLRRGRQGDEVQKARLEEKLAEAKAKCAEYADVEPLQGRRKGDEPALMLEKKKLDEALGKLGTPNLAAIDKYEQRARDLEEQKKRVEQLGLEKEAVISIISEIEGKKKNTFMATFDHINESFKNLFKEIFTGKGSLYLENPDSPFEGGLTIQVQLENKEIRYLEIMSGGEKSLIALLFIFAMQSANPTGSVYILDEADAALDQENSRKLSLLLKELSKRSQFIVVTHNEAVYKHADCLIGVAMQGKQGSKIVEVNVSDYT